MIDPDKFEEVSEFYEVEKTIVVVIEGESIRLEALRRIDGPAPHRYETQGYIERTVLLTPACGEDGSQGTGVPAEEQVWVHYETPWTDGDSADDALTQSLSLMRFKGIPPCE